MFIIKMYHLGCVGQGLWLLSFQKKTKYFVAACLQAALKFIKIPDLHGEVLSTYRSDARVAYLSTLRKLNWTQELIEASGFVKSELRDLYKDIKEEVRRNDWSREEVIFKCECKQTNIPRFFTV